MDVLGAQRPIEQRHGLSRLARERHAFQRQGKLRQLIVCSARCQHDHGCVSTQARACAAASSAAANKKGRDEAAYQKEVGAEKLGFARTPQEREVRDHNASFRTKLHRAANYTPDRQSKIYQLVNAAKVKHLGHCELAETYVFRFLPAVAVFH